MFFYVNIFFKKPVTQTHKQEGGLMRESRFYTHWQKTMIAEWKSVFFPFPTYTINTEKVTFPQPDTDICFLIPCKYS